MISKEKMDFAVKQVVENCLHMNKNEKTYVITDEETLHIGKALYEHLLNFTKDIKLFKMEDFGKRPEDGFDSLKCPKELKDYIESADVGIYAAQGKKGEYPSFRAPMLESINKNKKLRHAHMIGINDLLMEMGMSSDYRVVKETTAKVKKIVESAKRIKVTTALGTDIEAVFSSNIKWCVFDGHIAPGTWSNLPDGEIFTAPEDINGTLVVDGVLGDSLMKYGLVEQNPITVIIKNERAVQVRCDNKEIEQEFIKYINQGENSDRVGEFAIGTNIGLTHLVGNMLQDEKFPGVHVALGDPFPHETGANWSANSHLDLVIQKVNVLVDDKPILHDGKFVI